MPTRPWSEQILSTVAQYGTHTLQLVMVQCLTARWAKNDYVQQSSVTQILTDLLWWEPAQRLYLMYEIVHNLVLIKQ